MRPPLVVGIVAVLVGTASAAGAAKNGLVAFGMCCGGDVGIYVIKPDGTGQKRLYKPKFDDADLGTSWSPNGKKIAFDAPNGVWTMSSVGKGVTRLTKGNGGTNSLAWAPDGTKIAFSDQTTRKNENHDIWVIGADGHGLRRLIGGKTDDYEPAWSPDGKTILFARGDYIWAARADGTAQKKLIKGESPVWSPDGSKIAYDVRGDIWTAKRDGTGAFHVVGIPSSEAGFAWSPDGQWIVYGSGDRADLQLIHPDGTGTKRLTHESDLFHSYPSWQRKP
jgi:Tol biopolymer transport system component